jgi:hypothetical protein
MEESIAVTKKIFYNKGKQQEKEMRKDDGEKKRIRVENDRKMAWEKE